MKTEMCKNNFETLPCRQLKYYYNMEQTLIKRIKNRRLLLMKQMMTE
jgi:hypothetical protein